ncbi:MAG: hydantoinase/oxoprolinase family protein [Granulosicoccus sp.]
MAFQLGLDTGGTYTDAVLVDDQQQVVRSAKSLTTHGQLIDGLRVAALKVLADDAQNVNLVSLSTTLATNALVEGRGRRVCLVLIGYQPQQLKRARLGEALAGDPCGFIDGGHTATGEAALPLDQAALRALISETVEFVEAYAVSGLFAVRNPAHELAAQSIISELTGKPVSCGHHLSSGLDAPRRALTALLNARLIPMIGDLLSAARTLLDEQKIEAPLMIVKGDGSLIAAEVAEQFPVETILSGPAASVVGALFLVKQSERAFGSRLDKLKTNVSNVSNVDTRNLLVADMGGTTTDIALIRDRQPRLDPGGATVGGWRTMVQAVDVRTFGLGGDSAIRFDRIKRGFTIGPARVMPLSLLTDQNPALIAVLQAQLDLPRSTTHSAEFVMAHGDSRQALTGQQLELWTRIQAGPIALQDLFAEQTLERALNRLEERGLVLRAGFTPSDASHLSGDQSDWQVEGARLGAELLRRYSVNNRGPEFVDAKAFAQHIHNSTVRATALALTETAAVADERAQHYKPGVNSSSQLQVSGLTASQRILLEQGLIRQQECETETEPSSQPLLSLVPKLAAQIVGLGAPACSYYPQVADLLGTRAILPQHAEVANALGAVVGTVRQVQTIVISPAGATRVRVLLPEGPEPFETLEAGATVATKVASRLARERAEASGAVSIEVRVQRKDNIVEQDGARVFFESVITATAVGRPATADSHS